MTRSAAKPVVSKAQCEIDVTKPYRLDLTVSALRRLSTNTVDVITPEGEYVRALGGFRKPVLVRVAQTHPATLTVTLEGCDGSVEHTRALHRSYAGFSESNGNFHTSIVQPRVFHGCGRWPFVCAVVKPPRYPTLWEACVNAIVFQQVSLIAASSIARRMIMALGLPVKCGTSYSMRFPAPNVCASRDDDILRAAGLSANKLATLRRVADALLSGSLDEAMLEERPSPDAAEILCRIKGIGPWTATVILLRGLGRLDVFPMNDSSVARNLAFVAGAAAVDIDRVLTALGPQRGMLYYHLLLARLDVRGEIGRASFT